MSARALRHDEWGRTAQTGVPLFRHVAPHNVDILVVEEGEHIIGSLTVLRATHFEGLWIHPEKRGNPGVVRSLLRLGTAIASVRGEEWIFAGADGDEMRGYLERVGGKRVPMDLYALPLGRT